MYLLNYANILICYIAQMGYINSTLVLENDMRFLQLLVPDRNNQILVNGNANRQEASGQTAKKNQARNDWQPNPQIRIQGG